MASPRPSDARELEAGLPTAHQEKLPLTASYGFDTYTKAADDEQQQQPRRMLSPSRRLLLALAVCFFIWLGVTTAAPPSRQWGAQEPCQRQGAGNDAKVQVPVGGGASGCGNREAGTQSESSAFGCLLNAASSEALHDVLHRYFPNRFKDGIYQSDHSAMEAVHREDPPLATSLVQIAKRQAGSNSTTSTTTSPTTSPGGTTTTTPTTTLPPPTTITTTPSPTSTSPSSSPTTTSPDSTSTTVPSSTTSSRSQRPVTTTYTSTGSNGDVTVVTATSFVNADPAQTTGTQPAGSLQTNAAVPRSRNLGVEAFAGIVLGGLILV